MSIKLEVGKRYVMRNGVAVGPLRNYGGGEFQFTDALVKDERGRQVSWRIDGMERLDAHQSQFDIVSEYIEPASEPLRWVENCKPDRKGIWASRHGRDTYVCNIIRDDFDTFYTSGTWCYLGPIPEILPPRKKVVQRLWLLRKVTITGNSAQYDERWSSDGIEIGGGWIRTDETREVEQ